MPEEKNTQITIGGLTSMIEAYGPFAFGLVALLAIWLTIVKPQLEQSKLDFERQEKIVNSLSEVAQSHAKTAESLKQTSLILERLLERVDDR